MNAATVPLERKTCCANAPAIRLPSRECTNCGRALCRWHRAQSPIDVDGVIALVPVCHPRCDSPWWTANEQYRTENDNAALVDGIEAEE